MEKTVKEKKMSKITTAKQYDVMVSFMEENMDLATNYVRSADAKLAASNLWKELTSKLNSHGPPTRDVDGWKKVWTDYKYNIRKKIINNKKKRAATGGGPCTAVSFNRTEKAVIDMLSIDQALDGVEGAKTFGQSASQENRDPVEDLFIQITQESETGNTSYSPANFSNTTQQIITPTTPPRTKKRNTSKNVQRALLEKQLKIQEGISGALKDIVKELKYNDRLSRKSYDLKREKFNFLREDKLEKRRLRVQELEIKRLKLNVIEKQLQLQQNHQPKSVFRM